MLKQLLLVFIELLYFCLNYQVKAQDVKTWIQNTNFNKAENWKDGRVPCSKQRAVFPSDTPIAIYMPDKLSISEMVLPMNGELIFPEKAIINLDSNFEENQCKEGDAEFIQKGEFWYNPDNWNITSNRAFPSRVSTRNAAVPHAYQVPCELDEAWFPEDTSFKVHVIFPSTKISKLVIGSKVYDTQAFYLLVRRATGKLLFPEYPNILISLSKCTDVTGCICGNEANAVLPTICKFKMPCPETDCSDPITLVGHCCPLCAAKITAQHASHFRMDELMRLFDETLNQKKFKQVESFTSKISEGRIQSIFIDNSHGNAIANEVAQILYNTLTKDEARRYGIQNAEIQKSISWRAGGSNYESYSSTGLSPGSTAFIVIMIILSVCFIIAFYIYKKRQIPGFSFARFDLRGDKIELELGTTPHEALEPEESSKVIKSDEGNKAFDNPVYGTDISSEATSSTEKSLEGRDYVENPMFMIFEDSSQKERE